MFIRRSDLMAARLVPVDGGPSIQLDKPIILIGRHPECDAVLQKSTKVSRRHCCLAQVNDRYLIRDLGSMNGVRVNGARVSESELRPGDEVAIGDVFFMLRMEEVAPRKQPADLPRGARMGVKMSVPPPRSPRPADVSQEFPIAIPEEDDLEREPALSDSGYHGDSNNIPLGD